MIGAWLKKIYRRIFSKPSVSQRGLRSVQKEIRAVKHKLNKYYKPPFDWE